ncbi:MAG: hypothetical protein KDA22_03665 [Phycisphaerales bacterium]|nr:hypothetical protein [Phycisphaerales bacterium]
MSLTNRVGLLAGLATLSLGGVAFAGSDESYNDALRQIDQLRAELAEMKAQQGDNWLTEQRATEIRSLVQDVLADADTRASLQSSGMTAGWDKGFFLASPDGNFKLKIQGQIQVRYLLNKRDNPDTGVGTTSGFDIPRVKLKFLGNIFDKSWTYKVQGNFSQSSFGSFDVTDDMGMVIGTVDVDKGNGRFVLEDAYIQKDFDNGFYVRGGQYKLPLLREELVSSTKQLLIERSTVNEVFGGGRSQGIEVGMQSDWFRFMVDYHDGIDGQNQPWDDGAANTVDWAFAGRVEGKLAGEWGQFDDFNSWNGDPFGVLLGVAGNAQRSDDGTNNYIITADGTVDFGGANLFVAWVWNQTDPNGADATNGYGVVVQGGVFVVPDELELYAQYQWGDSGVDGDKDLNLFFVGLNWFFSKNNAAKISTDFGYSFNEITPTWANSRAGWLVDGVGQDGQWVWRTQFQLLF